MKLCANCGHRPSRRGGRECNACARYRQRNGEPRPESLVSRAGWLRFEKLAEREVLRRIVQVETEKDA